MTARHIGRLHTRGCNVTAPRFPVSSLEADVARLRQVLNRQDGPALVMGSHPDGVTALIERAAKDVQAAN